MIVKGGRVKRSAIEGIHALVLTVTFPGLHCTHLLADFGAEVTKIENPEGGGRKEIFFVLANSFQVVVEGFCTWVVERPGIDYFRMKEVNF